MNMTSFKDVSETANTKFADSPLGKLSEAKALENPMREYDNPLGIVNENVKNCPIEGNSGHWDGERGNSKWHPDPDYIPGKANPDQNTWGEILEEYDIDGINFKDGEPEFGEISKGTIEVFPFSDSRTDNFDKADIELAEQKGCSPEDVAQWRKENGYTWHECKDMKTMQKAPSGVHNNISHRGGISEAKKGNGEQS